MEIQGRRGVTRRELLQRTGVAAGIVWVAPAIQSVPASAANTAGSPAPNGFARVVLVNTFPEPVIISINGVTNHLDPGETKGPILIKPAEFSDVIIANSETHPGCGSGDACTWLRPDENFTVTVIPAGSQCFEPGGPYDYPAWEVDPDYCN